MIYNLEKIDAKSHAGDLLFLYGDEGAERTLPLSKKELDMVKVRREEKKDFLLVFDRLPYHLYFLSFDSEKPSPECQEELRRRAASLLDRLEADKVQSLAVSAVGTLPEEMAAFVEGITLADYSFDRYRTKESYHLDTLTIDNLYLKPEELEASQRLWNRIYWCREWVNLPVQGSSTPPPLPTNWPLLPRTSRMCIAR